MRKVIVMLAMVLMFVMANSFSPTDEDSAYWPDCFTSITIDGATGVCEDSSPISFDLDVSPFYSRLGWIASWGVSSNNGGSHTIHSSGVFGASISFDGPHTYTVSCTMSKAGCLNKTDTHYIAVGAVPDTPSTPSGPSEGETYGSSWYSTDTGFSDYEWSVTGGGYSLTDYGYQCAITFVTTGTFYVKVKTKNSCGWGPWSAAKVVEVDY
jgi:hypothetical protein